MDSLGYQTEKGKRGPRRRKEGYQEAHVNAPQLSFAMFAIFQASRAEQL
jgi:hypothetical protein